MPTAHRTDAQTATRTAAGLTALLLLLPPAMGAQATEARPAHWEFRIASGAMMPTGARPHQLRSGSLTAAQVSWLPQPSTAITATFGWAKSRDLGSVGSPKLNAFAADVGVEARPARWTTGGRVRFSPFIGAGAGSRSYDYRDRRADATHNLSAYGALGGELGIGRVALRVEARDYVSGFKPLDGTGRTDASNDLVVMTALRFDRRATARR